MKKSLISVVVPVYGVEPYLCQCVDSIITQTYEHLEIILVDDGSPDGCPEICDEYSRRDNRIRVIHKQNGGLSDARNAGVEEASGEYVAFIDSDDWVDREYIEKLYDAIVRAGAEIAVCNCDLVCDDGKIRKPTWLIKNNHTQSREQIIKTFLLGGTTYDVVAWNKLYKAELFTATRIRFPKGKINEDNYTTYKLIDAAKNVVYIVNPLLKYRQRNGSITASLRADEYLENMSEFMSEAADYLAGKVDDDILHLYIMLKDYFIIRAIKTKGLDVKDVYMKALKALRKNVIKLLVSRHLKCIKKVKIMATAMGI